jgi:hypothetical protein
VLVLDFIHVNRRERFAVCRMQSGMTATQAARAWQEHLYCELRQEMARASQKSTAHEFAPRRNPITPLGANGPYALPLSAEMSFKASATFAQLNGGHDASAKRAMLGNPIFGYSTHWTPPVRSERPKSELEWELRALIAAERSGRKAAESELRAKGN